MLDLGWKVQRFVVESVVVVCTMLGSVRHSQIVGLVDIHGVDVCVRVERWCCESMAS